MLDRLRCRPSDTRPDGVESGERVPAKERVMDSVKDTKYANRARLETWCAEVGGTVEYRRSPDGRWNVTVVAVSSPETIVVTSGPQDSIEAGCVVAIAGLIEAGQRP